MSAQCWFRFCWYFGGTIFLYQEFFFWVFFWVRFWRGLYFFLTLFGSFDACNSIFFSFLLRRVYSILDQLKPQFITETSCNLKNTSWFHYKKITNQPIENRTHCRSLNRRKEKRNDNVELPQQTLSRPKKRKATSPTRNPLVLWRKATSPTLLLRLRH